MKRQIIFAVSIVIAFSTQLSMDTFAQQNRIRSSPKASVMQRIGVNTDITIDFSRPGVKGREIWGKLVPYGMAPGNKYSKNKPFPWRAGANENTTIEFNNDLLIGGQKLAAGKYSIHMIPSKDDWTVIFNKKSDGWGSFAYDQELDALRITVTPIKAPHKEWLMYGFTDLAGKSATAYLHWEKLMVPFKIAVAE